MKRVGHLYEKVCDIENVKAAILKASKGKRRRADVQRVLSDTPKYAEIIQRLLLTETFEPSDYKTGTVREGSSKKTREIFKPNFFPDQIVHWAIMLRITRKARKLAKRAVPSYHDACGMISYLGWITHSNSYRLFEKWIKPYLHIQILKRIIRNNQRKELAYAAT